MQRDGLSAAEKMIYFTLQLSSVMSSDAGQVVMKICLRLSPGFIEKCHFPYSKAKFAIIDGIGDVYVNYMSSETNMLVALFC